MELSQVKYNAVMVAVKELIDLKTISDSDKVAMLKDLRNEIRGYIELLDSCDED